MSNIQTSDFISIVSVVIGVLFTVAGSYSLFVINTLRSGISTEKNERIREKETDRLDRLRDKEDFRDYKRDVACAIQDLIEEKDSMKSRIDKLEVECCHIQKEHEKNHG